MQTQTGRATLLRQEGRRPSCVSSWKAKSARAVKTQTVGLKEQASQTWVSGGLVLAQSTPRFKASESHLPPLVLHSWQGHQCEQESCSLHSWDSLKRKWFLIFFPFLRGFGFLPRAWDINKHTHQLSTEVYCKAFDKSLQGPKYLRFVSSLRGRESPTERHSVWTDTGWLWIPQRLLATGPLVDHTSWKQSWWRRRCVTINISYLYECMVGKHSRKRENTSVQEKLKGVNKQINLWNCLKFVRWRGEGF